jgi:hypothetical protein
MNALPNQKALSQGIGVEPAPRSTVQREPNLALSILLKCTVEPIANAA